MSRQELLTKINHCCRVFMITLLLLVTLIFIQSCIVEASGFFFIRKDFSYRARQSQTKPLDRQWRIDRSLRMFLPDGTVHLAYTEYELPEKLRAQIYDLNDNLLWQGREEELPEKYLKWPGISGHHLHSYALSRRYAIYPDPRRSIVVPLPRGKDTESLWRYEDSGGHFVGFDMDGNRIGFFSSVGFTSERSHIKPLEPPKHMISWIPLQGGGPIMLWQTEHNIYQIDFGKQVVDLLFQLPDKKIRTMEVQDWMELGPDSENFKVSEEYRPMILCDTGENTVFTILRDPAEVIQIKMPEDSKARISSVTATREKIYMRAFDFGLNPPKEIAQNSKAYAKWIRDRRKEPIQRAEEIYQVDLDGQITLINRFEWTRQPRQRGVDRGEQFRRLLSKTSPAFYDILVGFFIKFFRRSLTDNQDFYQLFHTLLQFAPSYNPVNYLLSILVAGIVFLHAWPRRTSLVFLIGWIVFAALFNVVGLLVYLALNYTPTIRCQKCNKRRGLNSPQCPRCGGDLHVNAPDKLSIQLS